MESKTRPVSAVRINFCDSDLKYGLRSDVHCDTVRLDGKESEAL